MATAGGLRIRNFTVARDVKTRDYKLEIGNSSTGAIGLVAYTAATSKREAARNFREKLLGDGDCIELRRGLYYANVYLGESAFSLKNITQA